MLGKLIFISGYTGAGKTTLVSEAQNSGWFNTIPDHMHADQDDFFINSSLFESNVLKSPTSDNR